MGHRQQLFLFLVFSRLHRFGVLSQTMQPESYEKICHDAERDFYMEAEQAKEYGIIDDIIPARR